MGNGQSPFRGDQMAIPGNSDHGPVDFVPARLAEYNAEFCVVRANDPHIEGVEGGGVSAKTDFMIDQAHAFDTSTASKERREYARERCAKLLSVVESRNGTAVPVSECARILNVDKSRITRLVLRNKVWHAKQRMWFASLNQSRPARVVRVDEVREALAKIDTDLAEKIKKPQKQKNELLPAEWISITGFCSTDGHSTHHTERVVQARQGACTEVCSGTLRWSRISRMVHTA